MLVLIGWCSQFLYCKPGGLAVEPQRRASGTEKFPGANAWGSKLFLALTVIPKDTDVLRLLPRRNCNLFVKRGI